MFHLAQTVLFAAEKTDTETDFLPTIIYVSVVIVAFVIVGFAVYRNVKKNNKLRKPLE